MMTPLTEQQLDELRTDLMKLQEEFKVLLEDTAKGTETVSLDQPIGRLSRMDAMQQQSMAQANTRIARQRLAQVGAALTRYDQDEYGLCVDCGEDIGFGRLKARPESPFCLECQKQRE